MVEFSGPATYDELVVSTTPLWRPRTLRVRIAAGPVGQDDMDRLADRVRDAADSEGVILAPFGVENDLVVPLELSVVGPDDLIKRLERTPLVGWADNSPYPAYDRLDALSHLGAEAALLDPVGIRWLPVLALNELPHELNSHGAAPQDLLERLTFRMLTSVFRFGGVRYGEAARGQRLADSVITWPLGSPSSPMAALVDCKAASRGYTMNSDHVLRISGYVENARPQLEADGYELRYFVVVSSSFPGSDADHPFHGRAAELLEKVDIQLVYVQAIDLAGLALSVVAREIDPAARESIDWVTAYKRGLVLAEDFELMLAEEGE
ncbi:MAG: hypothetical protein JST08_03270 [Actinobacteria bacterium]|nr:hypothetical protein [Actinomycetota bacterium]